MSKPALSDRLIFARQLNRLPIPRKLMVMIGVFCLIIAALVGLHVFGMRVKSAARAYVSGESLWSKAQKDAIYNLVRYALFHDPRDYAAFQARLSVPLGDRKARLALEQRPPDLAAARDGLLQGGNHPDDIPGMIWLFLNFHRVSYIRDAAQAWRDGDQLLAELQAAGADLHREIAAGNPAPERMIGLVNEVSRINDELTPLENRFSYTLGEGARWLHVWLVVIMIGVSAALVSYALLLAYGISSRLVQHIRILRDGAGRLATGDYSHPFHVDATDEIGQLAASLRQMGEQRQRAEEVLAIRASEVDAANKRLIENERAKDDFFATVSHELRTPLTLILSPLELLLGDGGDRRPPEERRALQTMHNNAVRLLQMVNGLLDIAKVDAGRTEVRRAPVDVIRLTHALLDDFRPLLESRGIRLAAGLPVAGGLVLLDQYLYERILFNLVSNAVKFSESGATVTVSLQLDGSRLRLSVQDQGIGIAEADQARLFERFYQLESAATRRFEGTGLGLAIVKEFAALLDGTVSVHSRPRQGSTFTVDCAAPAAPDDARPLEAGRSGLTRVQRYESSAPAAADADGESALPKVLVAEDNEELAYYVAKLLHPYCRVRVAPDGEAALDLARAWRPDLILADVMMPKRDGLSLCRAVKAGQDTAAIPVILLTALTYREALLRGWEAGADEYLFKPFHPRELTTRVRSILASVSDRRMAYERLMQLNASLQERERALQEALAKLQAANDQVRSTQEMLIQSEKLESVGRLAAGVAHEVKNPLATITLANEFLAEHLQNPDPSVAQMLSDIGLSVRRADAVIKGLLDFASQQVQPSRDSLNAVIDGSLSLLRLELERAHVQVVREFDAALPAVLLDRGKIQQVFLNVFMNAMQAMTGERRVLTVRTRTGAGGAGGMAVADIDDTGPGVPEKSLGKVFDPFYTTKPPGEGTGLGLSVCRTIIQQHGGQMELRNRPEGGVRVTVALPL